MRQYLPMHLYRFCSFKVTACEREISYRCFSFRSSSMAHLQRPRTTICFWSGLSSCQWLCCSPFASSAHSSSKLPLASRCASLLKKSPPHGLRQEITPPETMAEVQRDTLNGKAGGPAVSQLPDAPVLQRRLPLSPDRSSDSSRGDKL